MSAGPLTAQARTEIAEVLTAEELALFESQPQAGMQHGYRVMRTLKEAGYDQKDLLVAALLHDVGKYQVRYTWLDRVMVVLGQRFMPRSAGRWAQGPANGWRRAFVVKEAHPAWGAELLSAAGGSTLSVVLVRRHQEATPEGGSERLEDQLLAALQWADDQS
jgi:hypothetical protein